MVLPSDQVVELLALWVAHTWAFQAAFATPYLRIVSAAADSGKTLLLEILAAICRNGWHAVNPSTAVLYRKIDQQQPTLLLDEMDNYPLEDQFADVFARHIADPPPEPSQASHPSQPNTYGTGDVTDVTDVTANSGGDDTHTSTTRKMRIRFPDGPPGWQDEDS